MAYLLDVEDVVLLLVDERENNDDCSRLSNSERKRVISSSILRISESKRSRIELNSESRTLKSPSLMGIIFLPAIFDFYNTLQFKQNECKRIATTAIT